MRRAEKSNDVKNTIVDVARELFILQGYKTTTIRQISEKAGITIGSIYHFFRDKEGIFLHVAFDELREFTHVSESILGKNDDSLLMYAFTFALELKVIDYSDVIAEVYFEAYNSWRITENLLPFLIQGARSIFHTYNEHFTDEDYRLRILTIRGARMNFIIERLNQRKIAYEIKCPFLLETALSLFNVPRDIICTSIGQAMELANDNRIELYGIRLSP